MYTQNEHEMTEHNALDIGQALRAAREQANISLQDIADRTRLSSAHLSALESGDFENLPGVGYIPGYIRNYCRVVGIDAAQYIASFKALSNEVTKKPEYSFPVQALVPRVAGSMVAMFTVLVGLSVYVGWTVLSYNQSPDDGLITSSISQSEQPAELIKTESGAKVQPLQPDTEKVTAAKSVDKAPASQPQPIISDEETQPDIAFSQTDLSTVQSKTNPPVTVSEVASATEEFRTALASAESPAGSEPPPATDLLGDPALTGVAALATARVPEKEVIIRATTSAWIEVTRADGEVLVTKLMRDGDELVLSTSDNLFLSTGNAGGLRLEMLNMLPFDAGQTGEILRDLRLNRESLLTRQTQLAY